MDAASDTPVILCADDFALSPAVSRGIIELLAAERLSATGCMTASPHWPEHAGWLAPHRGALDIGVHLTLTTLAPLTAMGRTAPGGAPPAFSALARAAWRGALALDECRAELAAQLDAFEAAMGAAPDFVDGHHHVQQLPGIRDIVVALVRERYGRETWLRSAWERPATVLHRRVAVGKALAVGLPGRALRRIAARAGVPVNDGFAGLYDLAPGSDYGALFRRFLIGARPGTLIMCHPGHVDDALRRLDSLTDQRESELAFLISDDFPAALRAGGVHIARFRDAVG